MLVRKKYYVQKSFRIDDFVERRLAELAELTGKSQNDLANIALIELLQDNKNHFLDNCIKKHLEYALENADDEGIEPFAMDELKVEFSYNDEGFEVRHIWTRDGQVIEDYKKQFEKDYGYDLDDYLRRLAIQLLSYDGEEARKYMEEVTDFRDYVKIRK